MFGINPLLVPGGLAAKGIFHIGRFAINKEVKDVNLFKQLMVCAIAPICQDESNIAFAEIDSKLLRILSLLGIKAKIIGKSIHYLGSETIPVLMDYEGLSTFYNANKNLVSNTSLLPSEAVKLTKEHLIFNSEKQSTSTAA